VGPYITQRICEVPASFTDYKAASIPYIPSQVLEKLYLENGVTTSVKILWVSEMFDGNFGKSTEHFKQPHICKSYGIASG
jgi:hypothetical protein